MDVEFDYSKLRGRIRDKLVTQDKFAEKLEMGRDTLSSRLNNLTEFSQDEMVKSCHLLDFTIEEIAQYFFCTKVQKRDQGEDVS